MFRSLQIEQCKENAGPQKTKDATKFEVKLFKGNSIQFFICTIHFTDKIEKKIENRLVN